MTGKLRWTGRHLGATLAALGLAGALLGAAALDAARTASPPAVKIAIGTEGGNTMAATVSRSEYREFLDRMQRRISSQKERARERIAAASDRELADISADMEKGLEAYVDWYFTWGTTHTIVYTAARAYAGSIGSTEAPPREAAAAAMNKVFEDKFIELVLRPDINLPRLKAALHRIATVERTMFADVVVGEVGQMRSFVEDAADIRRRPSLSWDIGAVPEAIDWAPRVREVEALLDQAGHDGVPAGMPSTESVDFSDMARTALIQSAVNNIAGFTTSLAAPTLTVLDSGTALSATLVSIFGPFAPFFTPEMLIAGTGIAMVTDYGMVKAAEYSGRDELLKSAKDALGAVHVRLHGLFDHGLFLYSDRLYAELGIIVSGKS